MHNELHFLGQILIDNKIIDSYYIHDDLFTTGSAKRIYRAIKKLREAGTIPDLLTLRDIDQNIESSDLITLSNVPSAANAEYYYKLLQEGYRERKIKQIEATIKDCLTAGTGVDDIIKQIDDILSDLRKIGDTDKIYKMSELLIPYMNMIEERFKSKGVLPGITTGFDTLDEYTLGFQKKQYIVVGARPSDGKTAIMLNMALAAAKNKHRPCIINLESNNDEMLTRIMSQEAMINGQRISTGTVTNLQFMKIADACQSLYDREMYFYDTPNITLDQVISRARQAVNMFKCDIIFIDYIQIIKNNGNFQTKREKVEDVSIRVKELARELDVPIVAMAQLNRNAANTIPTVSEFKESGQIEQDADVAILIYHELEKDDGVAKRIKNSYFIVDKNRNGSKGLIKVKFAKEFVKFTEIENNG